MLKLEKSVKDILETILVVSEVKDLKANPNKPATGTVIEAKLDKGRGPVCTLLVQNGTLRQGDSIVVGTTYGKVRRMANDKGEEIKEASPSTPVEVIGLNEVPVAGDNFKVFENDKDARAIAAARNTKRIEKRERLQVLCLLTI